MVKTLGQLYVDTRKALLPQEGERMAAFMARTLICKVTGVSREQLLSQREMYVGDREVEAVEDGVLRLLRDTPLAYVIGEWDFFGMTLTVNENVLIPRDDTCAVTDLAIGALKGKQGELRVLDLCTGSGCIGLAVAKNVPNARVTLADISQEALAVARQNVKNQKLSGRVSCVSANALELPPVYLGQFDLIVSNPPYITSEEMKTLPKSVEVYEPHLALHGGEDGLKFYRAIAENYGKALKPNGLLCFEFGEAQGDDIAEILTQNGYTILERTRDYNETERAILARYEREE